MTEVMADSIYGDASPCAFFYDVQDQDVVLWRSTASSIGDARADTPGATAVDATATNSVAHFFRGLLPRTDPRILGLYWLPEPDVLRLWTILAEPDSSVETSIHAAQMRFMKSLPEINCDFIVIYLMGRDLRGVLPENAREVR